MYENLDAERKKRKERGEESYFKSIKYPKLRRDIHYLGRLLAHHSGLIGNTCSDKVDLGIPKLSTGYISQPI